MELAYYSRSSLFSIEGGAGGIRTLDLLNAIQARSQLRYGPMYTTRISLVAVFLPEVELRGLEPLTSSVRLMRSPN